jgi:hypothetical protein
MEPISTMTFRKCYKASVNESETITEAKPFSPVRRCAGIGEFGLFSVAPNIERS